MSALLLSTAEFKRLCGLYGRKGSAPATQSQDKAEMFLHCWRQLGVKDFALEREYPFHPKRQFKFDVAFPDRQLAIEVEGSIWQKGGGGHSHPLGILRDIEKYNLAAELGWAVLRYTPEMLHRTPQACVQQVLAVLNKRETQCNPTRKNSPPGKA